MRDMAILFFHHEREFGITAEHYQLLKKCNPGELIIPISQHPESLKIDDGYAMVEMDSYGNLWNRITKNGKDYDAAWQNPDVALLTWYANRKPDHVARRYILTEWDVKHVDCSLREFWQPCWDEHYAAIWANTARTNPRWEFYARTEPDVPYKFKPYLAGTFGFCGMLLSDQFLTAVSRLYEGDFFPGLSEVRMATYAHYLGYAPVSIPIQIGKIGIGKEVPDPVDTDKRGIWHPVKGH